jgi:hypothetical protein
MTELSWMVSARKRTILLVATLRWTAVFCTFLFLQFCAVSCSAQGPLVTFHDNLPFQQLIAAEQRAVSSSDVLL